MPYGFTKSRIARGMAFPLGRSVLDASLSSGAVIGELHHVYYAAAQVPGLVLRACFTGEDRRGWFAAGKSAVWIFAVPSPSRARAEELLLREGLPALLSWLSTRATGGNAVRGPDHFLELHITGDRLRAATDLR